MENEGQVNKRDIRSLITVTVIGIIYGVALVAMASIAFSLIGENNIDGISIGSIICIVIMTVVVICHNLHTIFFISKLKKDPTNKSYLTVFNDIKVWTAILAGATVVLAIVFAIEWKPTTERYDNVCTIQMYWNDLPANIQADLNKMFGEFNIDNFESVSSKHDGLVTASKWINKDFNDWVRNDQALATRETKWVMYQLSQLTFGIANYDFKVGTIAFMVASFLLYLPFVITRTNPFNFKTSYCDTGLACSLAEMIADVVI